MGGDEGLTEAQLRGVAEGPAADGVDGAGARPGHGGRRDDRRIGVSDETWAALARLLRAGPLFELLFVIGGYLCLAGVLNSIGLRGDTPAAP